MHHHRWITGALSLLFLAGSVSLLRAQSLAELAKKEEDRRKEVKQPAKTYTNKDLPNLPPATASVSELGPVPAPESSDAAKPTDAAKAPDAAKATDAAKAPGAVKDTGQDKSKEPVKDQAYWAERMKTLTTQLDRDETFADALQNKINSLTADFTARDDPAQRAVIERNRIKALDELERLKKAIDDDKKAIADLEEEARRAGVPPGWLRI